MFYSIRHVTRFRYSTPISESVMEVHMQPRNEDTQRCLSFNLTVSPRTRTLAYRDHLGNTVHHFNIPGQHSRLVITAESQVEMKPLAPRPQQLDESAWARLDKEINTSDFWDMLIPSTFARPTPLLLALASELKVERREDPMSLLRELNTALYTSLTYKPQSTGVDSPIDDALKTRAGVCQDYAHIMIALVRHVRIPCRYVSGYLYHRRENGASDRSAVDATHAWVEAYLPELGWVGFDPTNNLLAGERHIRTAVGRDYEDVPPSRGVFKGIAESELSVAVAVKPTEEVPTDADLQTEYTLGGGWIEPTADQQEQQQQQ
jgi:transglutaminase-like putative cysteine protease